MEPEPIPDDATSVLFLGEHHAFPEWEVSTEILRWYRPDAIFVECNRHRGWGLDSYLDTYFPLHERGTLVEAIESGELPPGLPKTVTDYRAPDTPQGTAIAYALAHGIPLYAYDWDARSPLEMENRLERYLAGESIGAPTDEEMLQDFYSTGRILLDDEQYSTLEASMVDPNLVESYDEEWKRPLACLPGMHIRNEYMALTLNAFFATKSHRRVLTVNGGNHLRQSHTIDKITLQEKVAAEHRYATTDIRNWERSLEKVEAQGKVTFPWEELDYMQELVRLGIL